MENSQDSSFRVAQKLEEWKSRLIDLSRRNNLLYFRQTKRGNLAVTFPDAETIFHRLSIRKGKWEIWTPPQEDDDQSSPIDASLINTGGIIPNRDQILCEAPSRSDLESILKNLNRRSLSDYRERGVRILHAAFGMLTWREQGTFEEIRSPLVFVPIEMLRKTVKDPFTISLPAVEDEVVLNPALLVKLQREYKLELPPLPEEWGRGTLTEYLHALASQVKGLGWRIEESVEIGLFSFHKLVIYKDLEKNGDTLSVHPLIRAISGEKNLDLIQSSLPDESDIDSIERSENTFNILDADSSQRIAMNYALRGQSLVMWGPPGTGKSQTITNIMAECIARGKFVLFVSDKMAALEVVYKRLTEAGLDHFCLELHSDKANKQKVVAELNRCLDENLVPRRLPSPQDFEKLNELKKKLNEYVKSLHQPRNPLGRSAYTVLSELATLDKTPFLPLHLNSPLELDSQRLRLLEDMTAKLSGVWGIVEEPDYPWLGHKESEYSMEKRAQLLRSLDELVSAMTVLRTESANYSAALGLSEPQTLNDAEWLIKVSKLLNESPRLEPNWIKSHDIEQLISEAQKLNQLCTEMNRTHNTLENKYGSEFLSLDEDTLPQLEKALQVVSNFTMDNNPESGRLLKSRKELLEFLGNTSHLLGKWREEAVYLSKEFSLPLNSLTIDRMEELSRIAQLCKAENRPDPSWLDPLVIEELDSTLPKTRKTYEDYNTIKKNLDKLYTSQFHDLDLEELLRKYRGPYRSILRWLRPSFYRNRKVIAKTSREGRVPSTITTDLADAVKLKELRKEIENQSNQTKRLLGTYYKGYRTDFDQAQKALAIAHEILGLSATIPLPLSLVELVTKGGEIVGKIAEEGDALKNSAMSWQADAKKYAPLLPCIETMPQPKTPIGSTSLDEIEAWNNDLLAHLGSLTSLTDKALQTCREEPQNYAELLADLNTARILRDRETRFSEDKRTLRESFGARFKGLETNWNDIISALGWTRNLQDLFHSTPIPEQLTDIASKIDIKAPPNLELRKWHDTTVRLTHNLETDFETGLFYHGSRLIDMPLVTIEERIKTLRSRVDDLQAWVDFKSLQGTFAHEGFKGFFDKLVEDKLPRSQLSDVLRKAAYHEWIEAVYDKDPVLADFRRESHELTIEEFRRLDKELIQLSPYRVIQSATGRKPQDILVQAGDTEINILRKEGAKKRRIAPIRRLFQMIPNLLFRLKPCLLMSPLSVSQFLDPELMKFDLVLFDEASQIVPEDAVGAIYRGKTLVVAGDDKQLPPTSFFQKSMIDDYDWEDLADDELYVYDSILEECLGIGLPIKMLKWHYRSRHEELISFSNRSFYSNQLITFPSPYSKHENLGVKFVYVEDSIYDRGGKRNNVREAEVVAELVFDHLRRFPEKTMGVVTFSIPQMETVEEAIEDLRRKYPRFEHFFREDRLQGFFVKNLENVQGDERDIMIFSVGYGRDEKGQMTMNFGPLNKPGGERRLNVAITRAREKVVVVSSIKALDINPDSTKAPGVLALRSYLDYAENGPLMTTAHQPESQYEPSLQRTVEDEIHEAGYMCVPQLGCSGNKIDLAVVDPSDPGTFIVGVQCDGSLYSSAHSARDRDRLKPEALEKLGWKTYQVWSPSWVMTRDVERKKLNDAIETGRKQFEAQAGQIKVKESALRAYTLKKEKISDNIIVKKAKLNGTKRLGVLYQATKLDRIPARMQSRFLDPSNREALCQAIEKIVAIESPVHFNTVMKRLTGAWQLNRVAPKAKEALREAVHACERKNLLESREGFLWSPQTRYLPVRVPDPKVADSLRKIEHIPSEEIQNAMKLITYHSLSISPESLISETNRLFGHRRLGSKSKDRLHEVFRGLVEMGELVQLEDKVALSKNGT